MVIILGVDYWEGGHVHDGVMVVDLLHPIIQVLGNSLSAMGMVRRMVSDDVYLEVVSALDYINPKVHDGCALGHFFLEAEGKKTLMKKA